MVPSPGNQCRETSCLLQSRPVVPMASDPCRHGVFSVMSGASSLGELVGFNLTFFLICAFTFFLALTSCLLQSRPVVSMASDPCRHGVFIVMACYVPGNQCWETSCLLQSRPVVPMASDPCRHGVFIVVSGSSSLGELVGFNLTFFLICAFTFFLALTSCLLQSRPVVPMASDPCRQGVFIVMACSGLLCSWKPVLRDLLPAAVPSCCVYGFWSVPSWCFHCCVLFRPVMVM